MGSVLEIKLKGDQRKREKESVMGFLMDRNENLAKERRKVHNKSQRPMFVRKHGGESGAENELEF